MRRHLAWILALLLILSLCACAGGAKEAAEPSAPTAAPEKPVPAETPEAAGPAPAEAAAPSHSGEVMILFTSDVHCGVDQGFGYAGLQQIRSELEAQGYTTVLVDDGDAIQGEPIGTLSRGEAVVDLMNALKYDVAIPGNHEFDYGMARFLELAEMADFPYVCCNFTHEDALVFDPYVILDAAGLRIAFVGVTTPTTITASHPVYFQNAEGEFIYGFMQDESGESVYRAVQDAVDAVRGEGADLVYLVSHLGYTLSCSPWTYADVVSHTTGIDVVLDGHSHDTEQVVMKNAAGEDVVRSAVGTKMESIGYSHISAEGEIVKTDIWSWPNDPPMPELLGLDNELSALLLEKERELSRQLDVVVAHSQVDLTINDPVEKDASGNPVRIVRSAETNLGDYCADAFREQTGAEIAVVNAGGIRVGIQKGDITYGEIISVYPFGNMICVIEATGQQILDALEWGAQSVPDSSGGFLQVSGMSYEIHAGIPSGCTSDSDGMFTGVQGEYRVKNVLIGGEPLDLNKTYVLAGADYVLLDHGNGYTMFDGAPLLQDRVKLDNQALIDYITDTLGGSVGEEYADPYGQGRIVIFDA